MKRPGSRKAREMRKVRITRNYLEHPEGSVLIEMGNTRVICTASVENSVPSFLRNSGTGWVTAEYRMLPRSTGSRMVRESTRGKIGGRTHEIQRLIGRSLRAVTDLAGLGERSVYMDCDVIQADGGTRTASITGAYVALADAVNGLVKAGAIERNCLTGMVAAVSVGIVKGTVLLDLEYVEDSAADVDMNVVMTDADEFVEVQSTAERNTFGDPELARLLSYGKSGIRALIREQKRVLTGK